MAELVIKEIYEFINSVETKKEDSKEMIENFLANNSVTPKIKSLSRQLEHIHLSEFKIHQVLAEGSNLRISGIAISEGTWNGIFYPAEELEKAYIGLGNKPLRIDHSTSTRDIVGKVIKSTWIVPKKWIEFEAIVTDGDIIQKLLNNLIESVSVGVLIDNVEENGVQIARNLEFKELSLVDDPACKDARINPIENGGNDQNGGSQRN
ncbi:hypothetical protein C4573_06325 [Candidatus Woesearchaeota archaeon]|nr:MAG: hypothetical protein C4573_06325 [Candidatus Woesearchaeota archaeon]